jgi:hypothetical protein
MATLTLAHRELYRRAPDERFPSLDALIDYSREQQRESRDLWKPPGELQISEDDFGQVQMRTGSEGTFRLNDWSFSQICRLSMVSKDTVNRVSGDTATRILRETMPRGDRPLQLLATGDRLRSVHGVSYSRLWNADLLAAVREVAGDYSPPQTAFNEATGLYCGEQDLFAFLIDPTGWIEVGKEHFAPGFFVWNSEVGKRSLGIQTFWFQSVCCNHIVWGATDVAEFTRKHTGNVRDSLDEIRRRIELQAAKRDERRDGFAALIRKSMQEKLGTDPDEVTKLLLKHGLGKEAVKRALQQLGDCGKQFTLWNLVDALTQQHVSMTYAGDRLDADQTVAKLLNLAA